MESERSLKGKAETNLHHNENTTPSTTSGEKVLILHASPQGKRKGPGSARCEKLVALLFVCDKLEKKVWEQGVLVGQGREQRAGGKGKEEQVRALHRTFQSCLCPLGGTAFGKPGGWAIHLHTHSIPNCLWDVRRNAEGLAGQQQVPLVRTSWDLGDISVSKILPPELEEPSLIPKTQLEGGVNGVHVY